MISPRTDWTICKKNLFTARHISGVALVARTHAELMSKINSWDKESRHAN